jgi:hypothetical protein
MKAAKVVLIVAALLLLALVGAGALGWFWLQNNSARLREEGKAAMQDGAHFGSGKSTRECVDEALRRLTPELGIIDEAKNKTFLTACLKVADLDRSLCNGVPPRKEIIETANWAVSFCNSHGRPDQACTRLVGALQERCQSP